jgi:homoserine O-acetyltransferase
MSALLKDNPCRELCVNFTLPNGHVTAARGRLTGPAGTPVLIVLGGISAGAFVHDTGDSKGWWRSQVGPGQTLDTERKRILSLDFLDDRAAVTPTTTDQAHALLALADAAGIEHFSIVGASYGGMIALALAALAPARVRAALVISAAHRPSALAQAWRAIQRDTVALALRHGDGAAGLDLARRLAMTTYRTPEELEERFFEPDPRSRDAAGIVPYLRTQGHRFAEQMRPERFLALSRSMDQHEVNVRQIRVPVTYLAVSEDQLVPVEQIADAASATPGSLLNVISSRYGHDAFLKETALIGDALTDFLES